MAMCNMNNLLQSCDVTFQHYICPGVRSMKGDRIRAQVSPTLIARTCVTTVRFLRKSR